ncbi:MAG: pyruvate kinase [endosymbiont of Galathealinum brachiosum]|uniref:Pyruvate kinase n=1 Tax=endosymbiont of Galathealinum brachiosum TaxID=2200906 RepID=A0A370DD00_9GAMM|nr:MAG: pyruvate kinase [endosymbiont of Galathealinum brachiosum]
MQTSEVTENIHLHWRRTKIIATLGPASKSEKKITELIDAGVNVFRLNMSHGTHEEHRLLAERIRKISKRKKEYVAILMDLCGPKIRVGDFENGEIELKSGDDVVVSCSATIGMDGLIASQYRSLYKDVKKDERILLDDGKIELKVKMIDEKDVNCEVIYGGILKNKKGLNLPDSNISTNSFTAKDKKDTELAIELNADFLALSFVRDEKCIKTLKRYVKKSGGDIPVIAKIEKPEAINKIEEILSEADGIMVARGDLGIEMRAQQVPLIQKELINKARLHGKPVIVATQMLESMITSSKPTRAEVGDVATAALSSTDAVMLSAETASGDYPVLAVNMMDDILCEMEVYQWQHGKFGEADFEQCAEMIEPDRKAVARAVKSLSNELKLQGIIVPTRSGSTASILSADRPGSPLIGVSSNEAVCRRLALCWGVVPIYIKEKITHDWQGLCNKVADMCNIATTGNRVLLVSGFSDDVSLNEPVLKLMRIKD